MLRLRHILDSCSVIVEKEKLNKIKPIDTVHKRHDQPWPPISKLIFGRETLIVSLIRPASRAPSG